MSLKYIRTSEFARMEGVEPEVCCWTAERKLRWYCTVFLSGKQKKKNYFVQWTKQRTINWQIIILLLHVSTLLCHLQGAHSQYLLSYLSMSTQFWWYNFKISHFCCCCCWISVFKIIKNIKIFLVIIIKWLKLFLSLQFLWSPVWWPYNHRHKNKIPNQS
jgi:hypothetical protein